MLGRIRIGRRAGAGVAGLALAGALLAPAALGHGGATGPTVGTKAATKAQLAAGKKSFSTFCGACHTLKAAGASGNIGPNLDKTALTEAVLVKAITNGGSSVMTKAQIAKYTTAMTSYKGVMSTLAINEVAAFVYASTHKS